MEPNDPAFERPILGERENGSAYAYSHGGLTKREYFAAMAMQGLIQNPTSLFMKGATSEFVAEGAAKMADALITELNKELKT